MGDHLIVMHSAVRALPGYSRHEAPSMLLDGSSIAQDTEHGKAVTALLARRHDTLGDAIDAASHALGAADIERGVRRQARSAAEDYFYSRLELPPETPLDQRATLTAGLEPMPDKHQRMLADIVEHVVDGDYEELQEASYERLGVDDLRRRLEEDVPEALVLPPREAYQVEALTRSEDPEFEGWTFFFELWTEQGLARLHLEGLVQENGENLAFALTDVLP